MATTYNWQFNTPNPLKVAEYTAHGISEFMANVLINRNISVNQYKAITKNFNELRDRYTDNIVDLDKAVTKFHELEQDPEFKVFVYCDYDTDGITSAAIANMFLSPLYDTEIYVPERGEGYGMSMEWCEKVAKKKKETDRFLVLTFDNGVTKNKEVAYLKENGIEVIITDHHEPDGELPDCIVVDPKKDKLRFGEELCGAEIAYFFFYKYLKTYDNLLDTAVKEVLDKALGLAAVGAIGDMVPMTDFNLSLVKYGLEYLNKDEYEPIKVLKDAFELPELSSKDIGFNISACINACGQMGKAKLAYSLFKEENKEELEEIGREIYKKYENNKNITRNMKAKIDVELSKGLFKNDKICLYITKGVPSGIVGKLAQHIANSTNKPAIVFLDKGEDKIKGSGRNGSSGINLLKLLTPLKKKSLISFANGHSAACGCGFYKSTMDTVLEELNSRIIEMEENGEIERKEKQDILIDQIISFDDINKTTYYDSLSVPYSMNFKAPVLMIEGEILEATPSKNNPKNICYKLMDMRSESEEPKIIKIWAWDIHPEDYNSAIHSSMKIIGNINRDFRNTKMFTLDILDLKFEE